MNPAASSEKVLAQSNFANIELPVPAANVTTANVTVSTVEFAQSAARSLPVLT